MNRYWCSKIDMLRKIIFLLILLTSIDTISGINSLVALARLGKTSCTPLIKIKGCEKNRYNKMFTFYHYNQGVEVIPGCPNNAMETIIWTLYYKEEEKYINLDKYNNKMTLSISPGEYSAGEYIMEVKIKEAGGNTGKQSCKYRFISEPPIIIFKYGNLRRVSSTTYDVDMTNSVNFDEKHPLNLKFECTCNTRPDKEECNKLNPCECLPIGGKFGMKFNMTIHECHRYQLIKAYTTHNGKNISSTQKVSVLEGSYLDTDVVCEKNCDGDGFYLTNPSLPTILEAKCYTNCTYLEYNKWKLTNMSDQTAVVDPKHLEVLEGNYRVIIHPFVLLPNTQYRIKCEITGSLNTKMLTTAPDIESPSCDIQPKSGKSIKTVFMVKCNVTGHLSKYAPFYQLFQDVTTGTKKELMLAASAFNEFEVIVGAIKNQAQQTLKIIGHDTMFNKFTVSLPKITVKEIDLNENVIEDYLNKIDKMYNEGNEELAGKYIQALLTEMDNKELSAPVINNAFSRLINSMNKVHFDSIYEYKQIATLLPHLYNSDVLDSDTKEELSEFCKQLSEVQLSSILKSKYRQQTENEVKQFTNYTKSCADKLLFNEDEEDEINVTTPKYLISEPIIDETYPNYDSLLTNSQIDEVKKNSMNTILSSAMAVAASLVTGQHYNETHENFESAVVINDGKLWPGKEIIVNKTTIKVVDSGSKYKNDAIAAVITAYKQELLESDKIKLDANIIDVNFIVTKDGNQLKVPVKFDMTMNIVMKIKSKNFTVNVDKNIDELKDHTSINVHRLEIKGDRQYVCSLQTMKVSDKLQVVLIAGRRPNLDDFYGNKTYLIDSSKAKHDINFVNSRKEDDFAYLGVLPHPDMLNGSDSLSICYNVTFVEQVCLIFDSDSYSWVPGSCQANLISGDSSTKIKCSCMHSSLFSANINDVVNKIDSILMIEFATESFTNYTILIFVSIVLFCYCMALCFYHTRYTVMGGRDRVFFMSDNLKNDRYGYLVIVKTGSINNSGTTSNIAFKLQGDKFTCKPHVFNYPDPQKRLLQIGTTDCYVLSTERYMGKIEEIHLWFDSIGLRPSWYCERITVIDLQTHDYYYFYVEKWLSVLYSERVQMKIRASKNVYAAAKDVAHHFRKCVRVYVGAFHTWNIVNKSHDHLFTFAERLTVIVSIIYTTYVLNIFFLYVPKMKMSDIYGYGNVIFHYSMVVSAISSSLLACLLNYPFIFFFRNSEKLTKNVLIITTPTLYSFKCNLITWGAIIAYIATCISYLVIVGFWVSFNTSMVWFINSTSSLVMSIIVIDNLYIIAMRMILLKLKQLHVEIANISEILKQVERQRRILFRRFGEVMLRPYFRRHYRIIRPDDLLLAQSKESARIDVGDLFKEMCLFLTFTFILYFILLADMDYLIHTSNLQMHNMLEGEDGENSLENINSIDDIYDYINDTILNAVHSVHWYGRYNSLDGGQMKDFKSKILGVVQLRQQRRSQSCRVPYEMGNINILCYNNAPIFNNWTYYNGSDISSSLGIMQIYSGQGYTALLGRTLYNSYYILNNLRRNNWIDINTKVLIIEFWSYNVNFNVFNAVTVIIERSNSGFIVSTINVTTARYIQSNFTMEMIIIAAVLTIILIVFIMLAKRVVRIIRRKMRFFKNFWNLVDIVILSLSVAIITLFFMKKVILNKIVHQLLESDRNEFINYFSLTEISEMNMIFSSFLLCLATIKLWKYLRFLEVFQEMEHTIKLCIIPMNAAYRYHMWTVVTFGWYFHVTLGTKVHKFSTFFETMKHLVSSYVDVQRVKNYMPFMDSFMVLMFLLYDIMTVTFTTIYLTIIICAYNESKIYFSNRKSAYNIKNYFIDETKYLTEMSKMQYERLRGGGDDDEDEDEDKTTNFLVYPKEDCKLYADSVSLTNSSLSLMQILTKGVIRNLKKIEMKKIRLELSDSDFELVAHILIKMYRWKTETTSSNVLFLRGEDPLTNEIKFVKYSKMLEMEFITKQLLLGSQQEETYEEDNQMIIHIAYDKRLDVIKDTVDAILNVVNHIRLV